MGEVVHHMIAQLAGCVNKTLERSTYTHIQKVCDITFYYRCNELLVLYLASAVSSVFRRRMKHFELLS